MLMPAILYTDQIETLIKERLSVDPDWFLYLQMFPNTPTVPKILDSDWESISRVSISPDDFVHGLMTASVCRLTNTIDNIATWSKGSTLFALDLKWFFESLLNQFDLIRFSAVKDAPTDTMWAGALQSMGVKWKVAGVFRKYARLANGKVVDVKWFEVEGQTSG